MSAPSGNSNQREDTKRESYSSESEPRDSNKNSASHSGSRKRASRAGTRSVSSLSAAQLERKRANDREAQRAIRLRTKEHIEGLERRVAELSSADHNQLLDSYIKRNGELEEEIRRLRKQLNEGANYQMNMQESPVSTSWDDQHLQRSVPRPDSTSFPPVQHWSSQSGPFGAAPPGDHYRPRPASESMGSMQPSMPTPQGMESSYTYNLGPPTQQHRTASQSSIYPQQAAQYGPVPSNQPRYGAQQVPSTPQSQSHHSPTQIQPPASFTPQNPHNSGFLYSRYPQQ